MEEIQRFQKVLLLIRRAVGWKAEEFGDRIGLTRQTINNLEAGRNKLTKTQYIAMRSVLDAEIAKYPDETEMLQFILDAFVDHPGSYSKEDREKIISKANIMAPAILAGASSRKEVSKEWLTLTMSLGLITGTMVASLLTKKGNQISDWLTKM